MHLRRLAVALLTLFAARPAEGSYDYRDECPRGTYATSAAAYRLCAPCPRGTYGHSTGLTACTAQCPAGKFSNVLGSVTVNDCLECPPGRYGALPGLTSAECSGQCPPGKHSANSGLASPASCLPCGTMYFNDAQCNPANVQRNKGTKSSHMVFGDVAQTITAIPRVPRKP